MLHIDQGSSSSVQANRPKVGDKKVLKRCALRLFLHYMRVGIR